MFQLVPKINERTGKIESKTRSSYISWVLEDEAPFDKHRTKVYSLPFDEHKFWEAMVDGRSGYIRIQNKVRLDCQNLLIFKKHEIHERS